MRDIIKNNWVYFSSFIFLIALLLGFATGQSIIVLIPIGIALFYLSIVSLEKYMLFVAFCTPISLNLSELTSSFSFDVSLPTEPLLILIMVIFFLRSLAQPFEDREVYKHPISITIYCYLAWFLLSSLTSSMPLVSIKQFVSQLWFITAFYFIPVHVFNKKETIKKYFTSYAISMCVIVVITLLKHSASFFDHSTSYTIMQPFFKDHTSYGAVLALLLPIIFFIQKGALKEPIFKFSYWLIMVILSVGTLYSYTRAAWAGIIASIGVFIIAKLRIRFSTILISSIVLMLMLIVSWNQIIITLEQNSKTSATDSFSQKLKSMTNIKNDDSNLERINRWSCAYRMFQEKPIVGFGPGTYMFKYGAFQLSYEKTVISTNSASLGNAHSEYLSRLAETGLIGMLLFVTIIGLTIYRALIIYSYVPDEKLQQWALFTLLALLTYYLHAFLNNFLDTDKVSALFWPLTAVITVMDVASKKVIANNRQNLDDKPLEKRV